MSFTIVTAMIFTAFAASLARESGCEAERVRCMEQGARPSIHNRNHRCLLVVREVLNATANRSGEGSQSVFDTTDKYLNFR